jgi:NNP family nitrate/nitrite transporter-like MFS transporter
MRTSTHPYRILVASLLHFDVSFLCWVMIGALGVFITKDMHLSASQKGLLVAVPLLSGSIARIAIGTLADRWSMKGAGFVTIACAGAGLATGSTLSRSYASLLGVAVLLGISGASFAVALPMVSRWFPGHKQGLALGVAGAGNSGTVIATFFAPRLAAELGWEATMALALLPLALMATVWALLARDPSRQVEAVRLSSVLRVRDFWLLAAIYSVTFGGFVGLTSFMPIFLNNDYGVRAIQAGEITAVAALLGSFLRPLGGYISDRINGRRTAMMALVAVTFCALVVGTHRSLALSAGALFVMLACLGFGNGAVFQMVPQRFQREIAVVTGLVGAAGGFGGFLLPTMFGSLRDATGTYLTGFSVFALIALTAFVITLVAGQRWQRSWLSSRAIRIEALAGTRAQMGLSEEAA